MPIEGKKPFSQFRNEVLLMVSLGKYSIAIFSAGFLLGINKTLQFLVYKSPSNLKINKIKTTL